MSVQDAFDQFQGTVNADPDQVTEARRRRDLFRSALEGDDDVLEVRPSGSLARGTHKDPIHDVDAIAVYDKAAHPGWGKPGNSAEDALVHTQDRVRELLGSNGTFAEGEVRLTKWRNHAVKCFMDDPKDPEAFTVDVMPALRDGEMFLVPEYVSRKWVNTHPQYLIDRVRRKHESWRRYAGTVRMLKYWAAGQEVAIKSLVMEVLALDHLPVGRLQPVAVKDFFAGAAYAIECPKRIPARSHCSSRRLDLGCASASCSRTPTAPKPPYEVRRKGWAKHWLRGSAWRWRTTGPSSARQVSSSTSIGRRCTTRSSDSVLVPMNIWLYG